jgi:hypothetical protein
MAAERDMERAVLDQQRAALVLRPRIEILPEPAQRLGDIDRPAGQHRAITERERVDPVMNPGSVGHDRVEVDRSARLIDDRRAGNAERVDIAARQGRQRRRRA